MLEHLEKSYSESVSKEKTFSIAICDIDDFKRVNDTYGHQCGDFVLSTIALLISRNLRETDIVCRWGGEELLILFPNTDMKNAVDQTEQITKVIQDYTFYYDNNEVRITITFGVCNSLNFQTVDGMIAEADRLLYNGKRDGKNCVKYNCL